MTLKDFSRFVLLLSLFTAITGTAGFFTYKYLGNVLMQGAMLYHAIFFFIVSLLIYPFLAKSIGQRNNKFMSYMFGGIFVKMMLSLGYLLLMLPEYREFQFSFIISFFLIYILFSGFIVYLLLLNLRQNSRDQ